MFRALFRLVLILIVVVAAASFFLGYWGNGRLHTPSDSGGTPGHIDTDRARDAAATAGAKAAEAANRAEVVLDEAGTTAKIKSKMALDDLVQARTINVTTSGQTVTLTGRVGSEAERTRAVQLARETAGVTQVVDRLTVGR